MHPHQPPSLSPWEKWELNSNFFMALTRWTLENPETSLDRVLDRVCLAIEHGQEFFLLIPDGAFPARGLVQALAQLVKLGKAVKSAKSEVQTFAKEVIHWVDEIKSAFSRGSRRNGFTQLTWTNLSGLRDIIEEICKWATSRLLDKRWSLAGIKNRLVVESEIADFKARITEARAILNERSIVNQAKGLDAILEVIWRILRKQKKIEKRQNEIESILRRIHSTQSKHLKHLFDKLDADEARDARRRYVLKMLSIHALENTSYVEQGKPPCDRGTRVRILTEIMDWVQDVSSSSQNFLWLTGDPGCGKSAITASIARECKDKDILWAQFFINRNDTNTTNPNSYFPSIALQLTAHSGKVEHAIHDQLKAKPSIMDVMSLEQASSLFTGAIQVAAQINPEIPVVIIIDGLDETDRTRLKSTASIFSHLFNELRSYPNAKVFISSRTEDEIRNPFSRTMSNSHVKHLHLDTTAESSVQDVSMFLKRRIAQIVLDNDLDWETWPGNDRMEVLAQRASGLFIWAVTAAKFFEEQIESWGTECLDYLLDKLNSAGMGDINTLYGVILSLTYKEKADDWAFQTFRRLIGTIVVLHEPLCLQDIGKLLNLRRSSSSLPVDIIKFVKRLRTILVAGTDAINGQTIPRLHKSFFEFITSRDRVEPLFYIDLASSHSELGFQCFRHLTHARSAMADTRLPSSFRYAFRFWSQHLTQGLGAESPSGIAIADPSLNLSSLERMFRQSSNCESAPIFLSFSSDKSYIRATLQHHSRSWSSSSGSSLPSAFSTSAVYTLSGNYGPPASPSIYQSDGKSIIWASCDGSIYHWDVFSGRTTDTRFHGKNTSSVAFSQNHARFVSGTTDGYVYIWDIGSAQPVGTFHCGHTAVTYVASSPTGHCIASVCNNGSLQFLNVEHDGTVRAHPIKFLATKVYNVTFSHDGTTALVCSHSGAISLWDTRSRNSHHLEHLMFEGHTKLVTATAFSPDGKLAASASTDCTIRLWNLVTGEQVGASLEGHTDAVRAISFSPGGNLLVSGSVDRTVIVWNVETGQPMGVPLRGHTNALDSVAFSPDGNFICASSGERTHMTWASLDILGDIQNSVSTHFSSNGERIFTAFQDSFSEIWDARKGRHTNVLLKNRPQSHLRLISFANDGSRIAAISRESIYVWDTNNGSLIACSEPSSDISAVTSLHFTPVGYQLVTKVDDTKTTWHGVDGRRVFKIAPGSEIPQPEEPLFFDVTKNEQVYNWNKANHVRWSQSYTPGSGVWAFMDNHIIRSRQDGSVTIVPVSSKKDDLTEGTGDSVDGQLPSPSHHPSSLLAKYLRL